MNHTLRPILLGIAVATTLTFHYKTARSDSLIAMGRVDSATTVLNSVNTVGGTITIDRISKGVRRLIITAPGAFAGTNINEFSLELSEHSPYSDEYINGTPYLRTSDELTFIINSCDLEDLTNEDAPEVRDVPFSFIVRKGDITSQEISPDTSHLLGLAFVEADGDILSSFGVDGMSVTVGGSAGSYMFALGKNGAFTDDTDTDYVVIVQPHAGGITDEITNVSSIVTSSDSKLVVSVDIADVQSATNADIGTQAGSLFSIAVYRIPDGPDVGPAASQLLYGQATVGAFGNLAAGSISAPGGVVTAAREALGVFFVDFNLHDGYNDYTGTEFIPVATVATTSTTDRNATTFPFLLNAHTLRVYVLITDVEVAGEDTGSFADESFTLIVYDTTTEFKSDIKIGNTQSLTSMRGNNVYNAVGAGQTIRVTPSGKSRERYFFSAENDGNSIDNFSIKEIGAGRILDTKYFNLSGGRTNVTAAIRSGLVAAPGVAPGASKLFMANVRYRSPDNTRKRKVRLVSTSDYGGSTDTARAKVKLARN